MAEPDAKRAPLQLDAHSTALVLHDLQNFNLEFPYVPSDLATIAENGSRLAKGLRAAGGPVFYTQVLVTEVLRLPSDVTPPAGPPPPPGSGDLATVAGFEPGDEIVIKRQFGAFYGTQLEQLMRRRDIKTLILGGVATELAIESTARVAYDHGFALVFANDAIGGRAKPTHDFLFEHLFPIIGRVASVEDILSAFSARPG